MTVLVTGASGFLGDSLVRRLLGDGSSVRALVRSIAKTGPLTAAGAETVVGDITDERAVAAALSGVTTVYHLAGRLLLPSIGAAEYRRTHVEGTRVLLQGARSSSSLQRFVHCSTTGVVGVTGDRPADETAPIAPTNIYEATKAIAEHAVRAASRDGFPAVVVRPGLVYGPGDLHLLGFFRAVLHRRFRPIGRRPVWLHPIFIDDLTDALLRCGRRVEAVGECFHIAGQEPITLSGLASAIACAEGTTLPRGRIPLPAARAIALVGDQLPPRLKESAPLTRTRLDFLTNSRVYDVAKAQRLLDFAAQTDLTSGVAQTVDWYRSRGLLPARAAA
jgi:nucleoside-diphosphate-sugar epimerase